MNLVVTGNVNKLLEEHNVLTNINVLKILFGLFQSFLLRKICESAKWNMYLPMCHETQRSKIFHSRYLQTVANVYQITLPHISENTNIY